jgi:hypothetical protein
MADALGVAGRFDLLVPSFVIEREAAVELRRRSRARDEEVYGEWAALLPALGSSIAYLECRGLDWETPDRFRRAVRRSGLAAWRRRQDTPAEWSLRTAMAAAIVRGFERAHVPGGVRVVVRRLPPRNAR